MKSVKIYFMAVAMVLCLSCSSSSDLDVATPKECRLTLNTSYGSGESVTRANFTDGTIVRLGLYSGYDEQTKQLTKYVSDIYARVFAKYASSQSGAKYAYNISEVFDLTNIAYSNPDPTLEPPLIVATVPTTDNDLTSVTFDAAANSSSTLLCGQARATEVSEGEYKADVVLDIISTKLTFNIKMSKMNADEPIYVKKLALYSPTYKLYSKIYLNAYDKTSRKGATTSYFSLYTGSYKLTTSYYTKDFSFVPVEDLGDIRLQINTSSNPTISTSAAPVGSKLDDEVVLGDYTDNKLESGKHYIFNITINPDLRFENVTLTDEWITDTTDYNVTI